MSSTEDFNRLLADNKAALRRIEELEAAQRWIPVAERLPEYGLRCLITDGKNIGHARRLSSTRAWSVVDSNDHISYSIVTHWMPLPAPPAQEAEQ